MPYHVNARAYLGRAKELLGMQASDALFYAAFELRACIEARQEEYAGAIEHIKMKVRPWQIGKTAKQLEAIFDNQKIAHLALSDGRRPKFDLYYTPVTSRLVKDAEKLGELLHRMQRFQDDSSTFWPSTRKRLQNVYREAWRACYGRLLVPPLINPKTKSMHPLTVEGDDSELTEWLRTMFEQRTQIRMSVNYLSKAPHTWTCDLDQ